MTDLQTPKWDVLALGEVRACFEERADGLYGRDCGGDALNVAISVARMGGQAAIAGRLGMDATAPDILAICDQTGVETRTLRRDETASNGLWIVPRKAPAYATGTQIAVERFRPGDLAAADVALARVLHLSGRLLGQSAGAAMAAGIAVDQARAAGVLIAFDPVFEAGLWAEDAAMSSLVAMAARADILFLTPVEAVLLFGSDDPAKALDRILGHGPQVVILSQADGVWVATAQGRSFVPVMAETGAYTLAKRETMIGTFLSGLTAGDDLTATAARALQAAQLASHIPGEAASIPALEDLLTYPDTAISPSAARVQPMKAGP